MGEIFLSHPLFYTSITTNKGAMDMINVKHLIKRDNNGRVTAEFFTNEGYDCVEIRYQYDEKGNLSERLARHYEYSIKTKYCFDLEKRLVSEYIEKSYNDKILASYENKCVYDSDGNLKQKNWGEAMCTIDCTYSDDKKLLKEEITFSEFNLSNCRARKILEDIRFY